MSLLLRLLLLVLLLFPTLLTLKPGNIKTMLMRMQRVVIWLETNNHNDASPQNFVIGHNSQHYKNVTNKQFVIFVIRTIFLWLIFSP